MSQQNIPTPGQFRRAMVIDASGAAVPFRPDPWQEADFQALDPAWQYAAGTLTGSPPTIRRAWQERPRGHSKTADLAIMVTWALAFAPRPIRGIVAAGDRDQAALLRDSIATLARVNDWVGGLLDVQSWAVVNRRTGATLDILSSDVGSSFGLLPDFIAVDEITHWPEDRGRQLWDSLLSSSAKRANCLVTVICNAGFTEHFAYRIREAVRTDPAWHFSHLDGPVASWITPDRLAEQQRLLPGAAYDRLWGNLWSAGTGDALSPADIQAAITATEPMSGSEEGWQFFAGLDLSVSRDHSALVVVGRHLHGRLRLGTVRAWAPPRGGKIDLSAVRQAVVEVHQRFRPWTFYDPYQAELLAQDVRQYGVWLEPQPFAGTALSEMASALVESFTSHNIALYPDEALLADLRRLRIEERPAGWRLAAERTAAGHCDRATALALALLAAKRAPTLTPMPGDELIQAMKEHEQAEAHGYQAMEQRFKSFRSRSWDSPHSGGDDDEEAGWEYRGGAWHGGR